MYNDLNFQLEMTRTNDYTLKILKEDKEVYLHSKYNPTKEAENWAKSFYEPGKLSIIIGNGLGYYSKALVTQMCDNDKLLIIEPSRQIFQLATDSIGLQISEDKRVFFSFSEEGEELQCIVNYLLQQQLLSNAKMFIAPNYDKFFSVNKIVEKLKTAIITYSSGILTRRFFAKMWQENYLKSIGFAINSCPITKFEKKFTFPAIIVAAGPSLTQELETLKKLYNKAIIICAGSAAPVLLKNNIIPHLIVSIDGGIPNYNHFKDINYDNIPLFYSPNNHYKILEKHAGPKVVFQWSSNAIVDWYNEVIGFETGIVEVGPSVANLSLDIACRMTNGPICFIGQDLGYTGGFSHAEGNNHRSDFNLIKESAMIKVVESNDGSELYSDYSYILMKEWFESYLENHSREQVYNATLKGARINGTIVIEFEKFVDIYCQEEVNIKRAIEDILEGWSKAKPKSVVNTNDMRKNMLVCISEVVELTGKSIKLSNKLLNKVKNDDYRDINKILNKLSAVDEKIKVLKEKDVLLYLIMLPLVDKMDAWSKKEDSDESKKARYIAEKNYLFYSELNKISQEVKQILLSSSFLVGEK